MTRLTPIRYANFTPENADDRDLMSEIWLLDVCGAPWVSREGQKLSAYIATILASGRTTDVYLRDIESLLNIQPEETARGLKLMKIFRALETFEIEKGKLTLSVRVGQLQRLKMLEAKEKLRAAAMVGAPAAELDAAATRNAEMLRAIGVIANAHQETAEEFNTPPPLAANN